MRQWAADTGVAVVSADSGFITTIGNFGGKGTAEFTNMCAAAGFDPVPEIFDYAGWTYTINGEMGMGGANSDRVASNDTLAFRYGVYMTSGTWQQMDHQFLDAYNAIAQHLIEAKQVQDPSAQLAAAIIEAENIKDDIDNEAGGMWLNYWAAKTTTVSNIAADLQKADAVLQDTLAGKVTPETITLTENNPELTIGDTVSNQICNRSGRCAARCRFEPILGNQTYSISENGVITPLSASELCMVQVKIRSDDTKNVMLRFTIKDALPATEKRIDHLLTNIAKSYADNRGEWQVMDMGAYALTHPDGTKLSDTAKQACINQAIASISNEKAEDTTYAKAILALKSQGVDPTQLYPANSNTAMSAIVGLDGVAHSTSLWSAPYTLMTVNRQVNDTITAQENTLIDSLLKSQQEDGSWNEWGSIDTAFMLIAALRSILNMRRRCRR